MMWKRALRVTQAEANYRRTMESYYAERNFYKKELLLEENSGYLEEVLQESGFWWGMVLLFWHTFRSLIRHIVSLF